jgi:hypothetical protein
MKLPKEQLLLAGALTSAAVLVYAGPLNPPGGAVAPTYKTLTEVEPRTALAPVGTGVTISAPGSYYLTENFVYTGSGAGAAISITSNDVELDLNGFTISGPGFSGNTASAIRGLPGGPNINITIRHGAIRNFGSHAVDFPSTSTSQVLGLNVMSCGGLAVKFSGTHCRIENCNLTQCIGGGVTLGTDALVKNNNIYSCGDLAAGTGDGVNTAGNSTIEGNNIEYSGGRGVVAAFGTMVRDNTLRATQRSGIYGNFDCHIEGNVITQCNNNSYATEAGIWIDNRCSVRRNTMAITRNAGIYCTGAASVLQDNQVLSVSGGSAIYLNTSGSYLFDNKYTGALNVNTGVTYVNGPGTPASEALCARGFALLLKPA